jgi:hypothetical protein
VQHRLELAVRLGEELPDELALPGRQRARLGEVIDEDAVRLVGRYAPSCSSSAISLRTVAGDTRMSVLAATCDEPTGCAVAMYSETTARRMAVLRSSSM